MQMQTPKTQRARGWFDAFFGAGRVHDLPASQIVVASSATKLDGLFLRRLLMLLKPYWWNRQAWPSWLVLAVTLAAGTVTSIIGAAIVRLSGTALNALQDRAVSAYWQATLMILGLGALTWLVSNVMSTSLGNLLQAHWKLWLTQRLVGLYLNNRTYYDIALHQDIDNPDQRIQSEVTIVVQALTSFPSSIITPIITSILQIQIVMSVAPTMLWLALGYLVVQTVVTYVLLRPSVAFHWRSTVAAAEFRHNLVSVREHAETIAFYRGESSEQHVLNKRLERSVRADRATLYYGLFNGGIEHILTLIWQILPLLVVTPLYFAGKVKIGAIAESTAAAGMVVAQLSSLKNALPTLANAAPSVVRLSEFLERMDKRARWQVEHQIPRITYVVGQEIGLRNVTIETPDGARTIVNNLDIKLANHQPLLITGQTGVGKSSVLRAVAGLWTRGTGEIEVPPLSETMFLPQRPYMMLGTLRQQIQYPQLEGITFSEAELQAILEAVHLPDLLSRVDGADSVRDWRSMLSLGEQQRLAFARVLAARPRLVFLDESTSAVDIETEAALYALLADTVENYVSVGHRPTLVNYHSQHLHLRADGWRLDPINTAAAQHGLADLEA